MSQPKREKPGPKPEHLKAEGVEWEEAMRHALQKKKPEDGWPEDVAPPKMKQPKPPKKKD